MHIRDKDLIRWLLAACAIIFASGVASGWFVSRLFG